MVAALFNPETAVTEILVEAGSDLEARTNAGATVLHLAVRRDVPLERLLVLLRAGADPRARVKSRALCTFVPPQVSDRYAAMLLTSSFSAAVRGA
jgi:hypothetical protein